MTNAEWARTGADRIIKNHGDEGAIDTANYIECGFIIAAAQLALENAEFAALIGTKMEPDRQHRQDRQDAG